MLDATDSQAISLEYDSDLEEDEYEVEKILKHRVIRRGKERMTEYYIKWRGFDEHWNSWEPENKVDAENLVDEYWQGKSKKKLPRDPVALKRLRSPSIGSSLPTTPKKPRAATTPVVSSTTRKDHVENSEQSLDTPKVDRPFATDSRDTESTMLDRPEQRLPSTDVSTDGVVPSSRQPSSQRRPHRQSPPQRRSSQRQQSEEETEEVIFDLDFRTELSWNWERSISSVEAVTHEGPVLYGVVRWNDGTLAMYPTSLIRRRCAQKLIDFYEKKLEFPEADAGLLISN
ncbi:hypothetical protein BJV82DRAFT_589158 [Fennellomyces sp. T-0311]|nr:hypothetical protein BJV82DRAFT_589158 [Fennellomyces sp. T-0311]